MIYRFTFFSFCFFICRLLDAQGVNLVPNGSFEDRVECIYNDSSVEDAPPWFNPAIGFYPATPDVFHECGNVNDNPCPYPEQVYLDPWFFGVPTNTFGCQSPFDGAGYSGAFFFGFNPDDPEGYREYLGVELSEPLIAGFNYSVHIAASIPERIEYSFWNIQVLFTSDSMVQIESSYIPANPQLSGSEGVFIGDYGGWSEIYWNYLADGTEKFLYIGNFYPNFITDTLYILENAPEDHFGPFSYYYIDDVWVIESPLSNSDTETLSFDLFPNPTSDYVELRSSAIISEIKIFDISGRLITSYFERNSYFRMDLTILTCGVYIVEAVFESGISKKQKIVKQ